MISSVPECNNATTISTPSTSDAAPTIPRYYSQLKKAHKSRTVPELKEEDLEEKFVRGTAWISPLEFPLLTNLPY